MTQPRKQSISRRRLLTTAGACAAGVGAAARRGHRHGDRGGRGVAAVPLPRDLKALRVLRRDLIEVSIPRRPGVAVRVSPLTVGDALLGKALGGQRQQTHRYYSSHPAIVVEGDARTPELTDASGQFEIYVQPFPN